MDGYSLAALANNSPISLTTTNTHAMPTHEKGMHARTNKHTRAHACAPLRVILPLV